MSFTKEIVERVIDRMLDIWETADQWTQGVLARNGDGDELTNASSPSAIKWCALGCKSRALNDLALYDYSEDFEEFFNYYASIQQGNATTSGNAVVLFNDSPETTFEDVRLFVKCLKDMDIPEHLRYDPEFDDVSPFCPCPACRADRANP